MKDLLKAKEGLIVTCSTLVVARKTYFNIRNLCKGDYDKIYQLDDIIKDLERAHVNSMRLMVDIDIAIAKAELDKLSD